MKKKILVFTDGASSGNPGPGGWGSVLVFDGQVVELGGSVQKTTNNRMELSAVVGSFEFVNQYGLNRDEYEFEVYSDSSYVINGITKWIFGWIKNDWINSQKKPVLNRDIWEKLYELSSPYKIEWKILSGHSGVVGNERADKIAVGFRDNANPGLFNGSINDYDIDILNINSNKLLKKNKDDNKARAKSQAYSYLSLVDGVLRRHKKWSSCEECVKGKPDVKFRKAVSVEDEREIIESWGKTIDDIS